MRKLKLALYAVLLLASSAVKAQDHYQGPVIDMHVHTAVLPGERRNLGKPDSVTDILPLLPQNHIVRAAVITIAHKGNMEETRRRNDSLIRLCRLHPQLIPVCSVHPADTDAAWAEMERVCKQGVFIIKLHPSAQNFDVSDPKVAALAEHAARLHLALLFDSYKPEDAAELGKLLMLAITHTDTKIIIAHTGYIHFLEIITMNIWKKYPWYKNNIYFDISAIAPMLGNSPYRKQLLWVIRSVGVKHFFYGTDFPIFSFRESIASVRRIGFTKKEEQQLFYTNAQQFIGAMKAF